MLLTILTLAATAAAPPALRLEVGQPLHYALDLRLDPAAERLSGEGEIAIQLNEKRRFLWLNAHELDVSEASLIVEGQTQPVTVVPGDDQTLGFQWQNAVKGEVILHLKWTAPIRTLDTEGVFSQAEGEDRYLFSQFEATAARAAFPCFDQPNFKTPYAITLHVPAALGAFSNAPEASSAPEDGGWRQVKFVETKPLPSYLVAFAVGPFDVVDAPPAGRNHTPVRILTPRGRAADAAWAVEVTGPILEDLETYFDLAYPYEKLDIVSLPKPVGWGAMENAGLITMEQGWLISRPENDTPIRQRDYAETAAHEIAHQWFGDLVTPLWWNDLWLNESFASFLATKTLIHRWPEWRLDVARVAYQGQAMTTDSPTSARQIREPIEKLEDVESAFDAITYQKGEAVLTMVERWLGEDVFRQGVRTFLTEHAWGNATAEDFISAMAGVTNMPVEAVFESFLDQPGIPEITVSCAVKGGVASLNLSQARSLPSGPAPGKWSVPVCVRYPRATGAIRSCTVLDGKRASAPLDTDGLCPAWLVPNDDQSGYYRVAWQEDTLTALFGADAAKLSVAERVGLVQDASARVTQGALSPASLLDQLPALLALNERPITAATIGVAAALDQHLVPDDLRPAYERFLRQTYGPLAAELGLSAAPDESEELRLLRPDVLRVVGDLGRDPAIAAAAGPMAERWLTDRAGIDPDLVPVLLPIAGRDLGVAFFERLRDQILAETDRDRREALFQAMGAARDPAAVAATLEWVTSGAVDSREAIPVLLGFLQDPVSADAQWRWANANFEKVEAMVPTAARSYLVYLGLGFCDEAGKAEVDAFFAPKVGRWPGGRHALDQALEGIQVCSESVEKQRDGVRQFLESQP